MPETQAYLGSVPGKVNENGAPENLSNISLTLKSKLKREVTNNKLLPEVKMHSCTCRV